MQLLLQRFYLKTIQKHSLKMQKQRDLDNFFRAALASEKITPMENVDEIKGFNSISLSNSKRCEKETSFADLKQTYIFSPEKTLDITFSPASPKAKKIHQEYSSCSYHKLILLAIFINYSQSKKYSFKEAPLNNSQRNSIKSIKKVKNAMVNAANTYKELNKQKYLKIRFLYEKLLNYLQQQNLNKKEQYIRIIIQEFQQNYIKEIFLQLQFKNSELLYSKSLNLLSTHAHELSQELQGCQNNQFKKLQPVLNYLDICLMINNNEYGGCRNNLHIQIEYSELNQQYLLTDIRSSSDISCSDNLFLISSQLINYL